MRAGTVALTVSAGAALIAILIMAMLALDASRERYVTIAGGGGTVYRTDRQTGQILACDSLGCEQVQPSSTGPNRFDCLETHLAGGFWPTYFGFGFGGLAMLALGFALGRRRRA